MRTRSAKKREYEEGEWCAVPLRRGGYAVGLIARKGRGGIILGYFFGPRRDSVPTVDELEKLTSKDATLVAMVGDLGLIQAEWPLLGKDVAWSREAWPVPRFLREDSLTSRKVLVSYSEDLREVSNTPCDESVADRFPRDFLAGYVALARRLEALLSPKG
jgi:hypothetical protein